MPVTVSAFRMMRQALGMMREGAPDNLACELKGKLHRSTFSNTSFQAQGELELPSLAGDGK